MCPNAPPLCTDVYDLLRCSAVVGNLGERGEPDILTTVRPWDLVRGLRTGQAHGPSILSMDPNCMDTLMVGNRTRGLLFSRRALTYYTIQLT